MTVPEDLEQAGGFWYASGHYQAPDWVLTGSDY